MTLEEAFDRVELDPAIRYINRARRTAETDEVERAKALLRGLEGLLVASSIRAGRDLDSGEALEELETLLSAAGGSANTTALRDFLEPITERLIEALLDRPAERLASYGSLRPGGENHHHIAELVGEWSAGEVRGTLYPEGRATTRGHPCVVWHPDGDVIALHMFESAALPHHWARLDAFEGSGYQRILVPVDTPGGLRVANLYALADS